VNHLRPTDGCSLKLLPETVADPEYQIGLRSVSVTVALYSGERSALVGKSAGRHSRRSSVDRCPVAQICAPHKGPGRSYLTAKKVRCVTRLRLAGSVKAPTVNPRRKQAPHGNRRASLRPHAGRTVPRAASICERFGVRRSSSRYSLSRGSAPNVRRVRWISARMASPVAPFGLSVYPPEKFIDRAASQIWSN